MKYNHEFDTVISADDKGIIEYWNPSSLQFPETGYGSFLLFWRFTVRYWKSSFRTFLFCFVGVGGIETCVGSPVVTSFFKVRVR